MVCQITAPVGESGTPSVADNHRDEILIFSKISKQPRVKKNKVYMEVIHDVARETLGSR